MCTRSASLTWAIFQWLLGVHGPAIIWLMSKPCNTQRREETPHQYTTSKHTAVAVQPQRTPAAEEMFKLSKWIMGAVTCCTLALHACCTVRVGRWTGVHMYWPNPNAFTLRSIPSWSSMPNTVFRGLPERGDTIKVAVATCQHQPPTMRMAPGGEKAVVGWRWGGTPLGPVRAR